MTEYFQTPAPIEGEKGFEKCPTETENRDSGKKE